MKNSQGVAENGTHKYLGILEADTIKQVEMKNKIQKEYLRRTRKLLETKLNSRNLIKGINTWAVTLVRYSGPFLKRTRDELRQTYYTPETTWTDYMYQEKREEEEFPALKTALTHRYNDSKTT